MEETDHCNGCGGSLDEWDLQGNFMIHTTVGYGSKFDLSKVHLRLCCKCFDGLINQCVISPICDEGN